MNTVRHNKGKLSTLAIAVAMVSGCSSMAPNSDSLVRSESSIKQAKEVGAIEHAPVELKQAESKLQKAQDAFNKEDYKTSLEYALEAEASADLAEVTARNKKTQLALDEVQKSIQTLKQQLSNR